MKAVIEGPEGSPPPPPQNLRGFNNVETVCIIKMYVKSDWMCNTLLATTLRYMFAFFVKRISFWFMVVMCITHLFHKKCIDTAFASNGDVSKYFRTGRETKHKQSINQLYSFILSRTNVESFIKLYSFILSRTIFLSSYCPLPKVWSLYTIWDIHRNIKICVEDITNVITKVQYYKCITYNFCAMLSFILFSLFSHV